MTVNMDRTARTIAKHKSTSSASMSTSNGDGDTSGPLGRTEASVEDGETFSSAAPKSANDPASTVKDEGVELK